MERETIMKKYNCSLSDACTIEKILPVKEYNTTCRPDNKCPYKTGYVMPVYHGYQWAPTKKDLIKMFTYAKI